MATKDETKIQNNIRAVLSEIGIVRRNNVGTFFTAYGTPINIGLPGEADLTLFCKNGNAYFVEVKTAKGRQSKKQKMFQTAVERLGFKYIVMRSVDDAKAFVNEVKNE